MLIFLPTAAFWEFRQEPHVSFGINEQNRHASGRQQRNDEAEILPKEPACSFAGIVTRHDRSVPDKDTPVAVNLFDPYRAELPLHFWPDGEDVSHASRMKPLPRPQMIRNACARETKDIACAKLSANVIPATCPSIVERTCSSGEA